MDITRILYELNLEKFAENFVSNNVCLEDLRQFSDEAFWTLGVHRIKDKCRLKRKCDEVLIGKSRPDIQDKRTYIDLKRVFGELNTAKLADKFRDESIGFEDVIYLSENDLKTIGVDCASERRRIIRESERLMNEMQYEYDLLDHEEIPKRMENGNTTVLDDINNECVGDSDRKKNYHTRMLSDTENDEFRKHEGYSDRMSQENGNTRNQCLQMNVELGANSKYEKGDRGNDVKCNQTITAETIGKIGGALNTGLSPCCSSGEKTTVKMGENARYKAVRENNRIERNQNCKADHIGTVNGGEAAAEDNVKVHVGANSTFEMNDSNNIWKSSQNRSIDIKVGDNVALNGGLEKVNHSNNRVPSPLTFHSKHGRNINLSADKMTAKRNGNADESTDVFSSRPICGEEIGVVVQDKVMKSGSVLFGITSCNPADLIINELPDESNFLLEREEYWVINENVCNKLKKGDKLRFFLSFEGDVSYSKNNETEIFFMAVDVSCPIWAHFRLNGSVKEIQILGHMSSRKKEVECQPVTGNSIPSTSRPISTPRPEHFVLEPFKFHKKCGRNISLKFHRTTAERSGNYPQDTYAFTSRNIYPGEEIDLQINTSRVNDGLKFGLTVCNPEDLNVNELPNDSHYLADREEYWLIETLLYKTSQTRLKARVRYTCEGYVLYSVNNQKEKLLFHVDTSVDLWAYFMLGHNQSIEIISKDSRSSPEKKVCPQDNRENDASKFRPRQNDNKKSNMVRELCTSAISTAVCIGTTMVALPFAGVGAPLVGIAAGAIVHSKIK